MVIDCIGRKNTALSVPRLPGGGVFNPGRKKKSKNTVLSYHPCAMLPLPFLQKIRVPFLTISCLHDEGA